MRYLLALTVLALNVIPLASADQDRITLERIRAILAADEAARIAGNGKPWVSTNPDLQAFLQEYPAPPAPKAEPTGSPAWVVVVNCPAEATVSFGGVPSAQRGTQRSFVTPPIAYQGTYRVTITMDGWECSKTVVVSPGQTTTVTAPRSVAATPLGPCGVCPAGACAAGQCVVGCPNGQCGVGAPVSAFQPSFMPSFGFGGGGMRCGPGGCR